MTHRPFPEIKHVAWLMLCDIAESEPRMLTVSDVCTGSTAPWTTAMRHTSKLVDHGLARREPDPADKRRVYLVLTDRARAGLAVYARGVAA